MSSYPRNGAQWQKQSVQKTRDFLHGLNGWGPNTAWGRAGDRIYEQNRSKSRGGVSAPPSTSRGSGFGQFLVIGVIGLLVYAYFDSESGSRGTVRDTARVSERTDAPAASLGTRPRSAAAPQQESSFRSNRDETARQARLPVDERVSNLTREVQQLSGETFFVTEDRERLVFEWNLANDAHDLVQTSFDVRSLDLNGLTYDAAARQLKIPCVAGAACVTYRVYGGQSQASDPPALQKRIYPFLNVLSDSEDDAHRIVQDFDRLQQLER